MNDSKVYHCCICGSKDIQIRAWINPNGNIYCSDIDDNGECWCDNCNKITRIKVFEKPKDMEIKTIEELKKLASREDGCDCYVRLSCGVRSSKHIRYYNDTGTWYVYHEIDSSEALCTTDELDEKTTIIDALKKHALILD